MIKVLYAPLNFGQVCQVGTYDAIREAGCQLEIFDYFQIYDDNQKRKQPVRNQFIGKALNFQPDLILLQIQHTDILDGRTIGEIKKALPNCIIANYTIDVRSYVPLTFKDIARFSDLNLITSTGQIDFFKREIHKDIKYWQTGYNPKLYYPNPINDEEGYLFDCTFVANFNSKEQYPGRVERERTAEILRRDFGTRFCLYGNHWPAKYGVKGDIEQKYVSQAYHKSICSISVSHFNDIDHYFSDRLLICMASGRPTISLKFPRWESLFTDGCDLVIANSVEEIPEKVRWLKANPDIADYIGKSGAEKVRHEHCYLNRINELLDMAGLRNK